MCIITGLHPLEPESPQNQGQLRRLSGHRLYTAEYMLQHSHVTSWSNSKKLSQKPTMTIFPKTKHNSNTKQLNEPVAKCTQTLICGAGNFVTSCYQCKQYVAWKLRLYSTHHCTTNAHRTNIRRRAKINVTSYRNNNNKVMSYLWSLINCVHAN